MSRKYNAAVRNRKKSADRNDKQMLFLLSENLYEEMRDVAYSNDKTLSAFIRESIRRNIMKYKERFNNV